MFSFLHTIGLALEQRYPEKDFILQHCSFLDVSRRKFHVCDIGAVVDKFSNDHINKSLCIQQYRMFVSDSTLDFVFECTCKKDSAAFFIHLYNESEEYCQLAKLALLIFCISPDSVACERGFSCMNYVKNQFRSRLTSDNLNAALALAQDCRSLDTFPFKNVL